MCANRGNCAGSLGLVGARSATPVTGCVAGARPPSIAMAYIIAYIVELQATQAVQTQERVHLEQANFGGVPDWALRAPRFPVEPSIYLQLTDSRWPSLPGSGWP
jgi:hypothetical protein